MIQNFVLHPLFQNTCTHALLIFFLPIKRNRPLPQPGHYCKHFHAYDMLLPLVQNTPG